MKLSSVKAHRFLAIGLAAFLISHFAIHLSAIAGHDVHMDLLSKFQRVYRNPVVEPILVLAILLQIGIGAKLIRNRWQQPWKGFWGWAQILSGGYLAGFFLMHTSAALATRYFAGLDTNFYWAAGTLNVNPLQYIFAPYYFLGVVSVFTHLAAAIFFGWAEKGVVASRFIFIFGIAIAALIVATFSGAFYEITLPTEYIDYFESYIPL